MKVLYPTKVFLLRGNHETRDVNGWEEHYGARALLYQCRQRFGNDVGYRIWETCNASFDRLPLAAVIDQDIFCVHGGIPRPVSDKTTRIQDILTVPRVAGINPPYEHEDETYQRVASDCIWSDPASEEQELTSVDPETGFGESLRGGGAICFGNTAVTNFLNQHDYSYIMRAHEAHAEGVAVSKEARVFTVFSTSKDHNQGSQALAGCMLVDNERLQVINRSPAYRNQYVHRRDSISVAHLPEAEIEKRMRIGLVQPSDGPPPGHAAEPAEQVEQGHDPNSFMGSDATDLHSDAVEEWEDFVEDDDAAIHRLDRGGSNSDEYIFDQRRRSSVDLSTMATNLHDAATGILESVESWDTDASGSNNWPPNKRQRSKRGSMQSIDEFQNEDDDEEVATVDGEEDMEVREAQALGHDSTKI
jgi:diadenosine tetraphosphatase ApaH/serine/threonine PP2A family protein phosphatase